MLGALFVEAGEGGTDWCTVMAELLVFLPYVAAVRPLL